MSYEWQAQNINGGFMRPTGTTYEMRIPNLETLNDCIRGLNKHIRNAHGDKKKRLKMIKEEIEFLKNNLWKLFLATCLENMKHRYYICLNDLPALTLCKSKDFWNPWWMFGVSAQTFLLRVSHLTTVQRYTMTGKIAKLWFSRIIGSGQLADKPAGKKFFLRGTFFFPFPFTLFPQVVPVSFSLSFWNYGNTSQ